MSRAVWWERSSGTARPDRDPAHPARRRAHAGVHAGGHPRRGAHPRHRQTWRTLGADIVLANTYHLVLRPGADAVAALGGLHRMTGWTGPMLTDSGGFQVFSLDPVVTEEGCGSAPPTTGPPSPDARVVGGGTGAAGGGHRHGPRRAGRPAGAAGTVVEEASEQTLRWAERSARARTRADQGLFGIVQGGTELDLRARSAAGTAAIGFDGYAIGGLAVGEPPEERNAAVEAVVGELPDDATRYVMGLGDTEGLLDAVARGADLFDCVIPTRLARHGKVLHPDGDFSVKLARWARSTEPLDTACACSTCARYPRGYLRHLFAVGEVERATTGDHPQPALHPAADAVDARRHRRRDLRRVARGPVARRRRLRRRTGHR